jgi:integrase
MFFKTIYGECPVLESCADRYFEDKRDYEEDLGSFFVSLKQLAPKTQRLRLSATRTFLEENKVELSQRFWRRLRRRIKGNGARTRVVVPTNAQLKQIMLHLPIQGKALYLTLASSGIRIGEALKLQLEDVELDTTPVAINVRSEYSKSGNRRTTFMSQEAGDVVSAWLHVRDQYLDAAVKKSRYAKELKTKRLFPFSSANARLMWYNALKKSGYDKKDASTNYYELHVHVLRKFFRSRLDEVIPKGVMARLMGHEGYLTREYLAITEDDLRKHYQHGELRLNVFGTDTETISNLKDDINETKKDRDNLQRSVNAIDADNRELTIEVKTLQKRMQTLEDERALVKEFMDEMDTIREEYQTLQDEIKFYKEGGISIAYTDDLAKEQLRELLNEAFAIRQKQRDAHDKKKREAN